MTKDALIGWRICAAVVVAGKITHLMSLCTLKWTPYEPVIQDPQGFYVGTTRDFCTDYYSGLFDPAGCVCEVLLKLAIKPEDLQSDEMPIRWKWSTGAEAVAVQATVLEYTILRTA